MEAIIVNDQANIIGGSAVVALSSARGLASAGLPVTLFTGVGPVAPEIANRGDIEVVCLGAQEVAHDENRLRAFASGMHNFAAARELRKLLSAKDPRETVVHVHSWTKSLSSSVIHEALERRFPVVITLHDFFIGCPTGGLYLHREQALCHKQPLSLDCLSCNCDRRHFAHKVWRSARTLLQNRVLGISRRVRHYIAVSNFSAKLMRPWLAPDADITVVRNPIEVHRMAPAPLAEDAPFVFIGRFSAEKGPQLLAEAARRLDVPAVFVGDGDLAGEIRRLNPSATITGWVDAAGVNAWMRRARALVFPPLWYETLGLVVIEAAANGVPSIIADHCAATDYIHDGENGLHFRGGSADALCEAMQKIRDPRLAKRLGASAYEWFWNDPWTADQHTRSLLHLYNRIISDGEKRAMPAQFRIRKEPQPCVS
jgi:glycosyltransferase involved in cell wall biosynthesis